MLALALGCSRSKPKAPPVGREASGTFFPQIVQHDVDQRPKLVTLVRNGDPQAALALVLGKQSTDEESIQLAALLSTRLTDSAQRFEVLPHIGGVTIVTSFDAASSVPELLARIDQALRKEVESAEVSGAEYQARLQQIGTRMGLLSSSTERALCLPQAPPPGTSGVDMEEVRRRAFKESHARWGVVGESELVHAVDTVVRKLAPWPRGDLGETFIPVQDRISFVHSGNPFPQLDITWWTPVARKGLVAKRELGSDSSALMEILSALAGPVRLGRVTFSPQSTGGCVSLSLSMELPSSHSTTKDLITAARISVEMLRRFGRRPENAEAAMLAVVEQADPRVTAELAARLSLASDAKTGMDRFGVTLDVGTASAMPTPTQQRAIFVSPSGSQALSTTRAVEHGQGCLYALIASPCSTWSESGRTVGATSLLLRALAARYHQVRGVTIDPWVTADGAGLIAHTARLSIQESPDAQARRLGDVIGRVLVAQRLETTDLWQARTSLLAHIGPGARPALWRALLDLSPEFPALVAPDGHFSTVEAVSLTTVQERRAELLRLPLRLAVIANESAQQGEAVRSAIGDWVSLSRLETTECPELGLLGPGRAREIRIEAKDPDPNDAGITLAVALPAREPLAEAHAAHLQWMLGRSSGWLAQRLRSSSIVATVDAQVVGGTQVRGLIIAIAGPPSALDAAANSVRGLLQDFGSGVLPAVPSVASASVEMHAAERRRRIDPKMRLEDLWMNRSNPVVVNETSFREYLKRAFSELKLLQVRSSGAAVEPAGTGRLKR